MGARVQDDHSKNGWHLKKEISFGHIMTTATILLAGFWWAAKVETRLAVLEQPSAIDTKIAVIEAKQEMAENSLTDIKATLLRIEEKLDQKADK